LSETEADKQAAAAFFGTNHIYELAAPDAPQSGVRLPRRRFSGNHARNLQASEATMTGKSLTLTTGDGAEIGAYRAEPAGRPRGGLVVIQEAFGVNDYVRSVVDRYAAEGYLSIAPMIYDRHRTRLRG
jgi:hypothetical protein